MKEKHTKKKSANRGLKPSTFNNEMLGIARKHGRRMVSDKNTHLTKPKPNRKKPIKTTHSKY